jgi:hypothetical protein
MLLDDLEHVLNRRHARYICGFNSFALWELILQVTVQEV